MAATVGKLRTILSLNSAAFGKGMNLAIGQVQSFQNSVSAVARKVTAFGAGLTAVAGGAGLAVLVKRAFESGDEIAKMSDRLGIAAESMQAFRLGANLAGLELGDLDSAISHFQRTLSEAAAGSKSQQEAFAQLGLDPKRLMTMGSEDQLNNLAEAFKNVSNQADRANRVQEMFGKGGREMMAFLQGGAAGLREMKRLNESMGGAFSRVDLAKLEQANDAVTRMKESFAIIATDIAITISPHIVAMEKGISKLASHGDAIGKAMDAVLESAINFGSKLADAFGAVETSADRIAKVFVGLELGQAQRNLTSARFERNLAVGAGGKPGMGNIKALEAEVERLNMLWAELDSGIKIREMQGNLTTFGDGIRDFWKGVKDSVQAAAEEIAEAAKKSREATKFASVDVRQLNMIESLRESLTFGPPSRLAMAQGQINDAGFSIGRSGFGIGFREIRAEDLGGIRPGTVFGEQTGEIVKILREGVEEQKKTNRTIEHLGQLNN